MYKLCYKNASSTWDEALPLGNGHFGAMVYNEGNDLIFAVNHYDVYYKKLWLYSKKFIEESKEEKPVDTSRYEEVQARALKAYEDTADPAHYNYTYALYPDIKQQYGVERLGATHPITGELRMVMNECVQFADGFESCLDTGNAVFEYKAETSRGDMAVSTIISAGSDVILTEVRQTAVNKIDAFEISVPERRYMERLTKYYAYNDNTVYFIDSFYPDDEGREKFEPFKYIMVVRFNGVKVSNIALQEQKTRVNFDRDSKDFSILTCVVTGEETCNLLETALKRLNEAANGICKIKEDHREYWRGFWSKSSINIPDKMLEKLWYINLYSLECCSGRGARLFQQACGLNGLWDIKQPSQWGSTWYWDVNIEQSFWPVYTSNHLEIAEVFNNGLLSYIEQAKKRAGEFYGFSGIAPDYPYPFYIAIWPWCAQHLWWYYKYSGDMAFLRGKAYPVFKDILLFYDDHLKYDKENGQYYTFPDISPEQGPVSKNSTITLACLKFLLKIAVQANKELNENEEDRKRWEYIYSKLPFYAMGDSIEFGRTIKDAEWASPTQYLAHSGVLMPVYPVGEITRRSSHELRKTAECTLRYAEVLQCLGTHNFGWEACASARLGNGDNTIRILYEKGIAFLMRTNGLFAEETERWIQNCLTACVPVYNPPLMEAGSALAAAINEMLLQSFDGVIEVFPAVPRGEITAAKAEGRFNNVADSYNGKVEAWKDCHFENLLAEGAFEVSAYQHNFKTVLIKVKSLAGNEIKLVNTLPAQEFSIQCESKNVHYCLTDNIISFSTEKDRTYEIKALGQDSYFSDKSKTNSGAEESGCDYNCKPLVYVAPSKRRVFLGKDTETGFLRQLDNITFDYYQGDVRTSRVAVYRFDFSLPKNQLVKDYSSILPVQYHACGKQGLDFTRVSRGDNFTTFRGYGWENVENLQYMDRKVPDAFRRDFICSKASNRFMMELPKGQYQVFIATGDAYEPAYTAIDINGQQKWMPDRIIKAGRFETVVFPFVQWKDGLAEIGFSTVEGCMWKLNMLIVNRQL